MHEMLQNFAREQIKAGLLQCTDPQKLLFRRMYSHKNLEKTIDDVVDAMPAEKLENALDQVERTVVKNSAQPGQSDE